MTQQSKPVVDPKELGSLLRERRKALKKTLAEIAEITSVDVGQLSRFENGRMKRLSGNLQNLLSALQELEAATIRPGSPDVVYRFAAIVKRSGRHAEAATAFVNALEQLT